MAKICIWGKPVRRMIVNRFHALAIVTIATGVALSVSQPARAQRIEFGTEQIVALVNSNLPRGGTVQTATATQLRNAAFATVRQYCDLARRVVSASLTVTPPASERGLRLGAAAGVQDCVRAGQLTPPQGQALQDAVMTTGPDGEFLDRPPLGYRLTPFDR